MEISSPPPLPPKTLPRSTATTGPISLISINTQPMHIDDAESNGSISLPHQITTKPSSTTTTLTQVVQVSSTSSESPSPTLPQTNGNIKTTSPTNAAGATVFIESKRPLSTTNIVDSTIDQQLPNNNNNNHVVKILINPTTNNNLINNKNNKSIITLTKDQEINETNNNYELHFNNSVLINVNNNNNNIEAINEEMIKNSTMKSTDLSTFQNKTTTNTTNQQSTTPVNSLNNNPYFFYTGFQCSPTNLIMSSGQCSPSDTLDSGTCSDLDMTPPPLPKKKNSKTNLNSTATISITAINGKKNGDSSAEECEDSESNVSCDSLNDGSSDLLIMESSPAKAVSAILPRNLLQDIREHRNNVKNTSTGNVETKIIPQPPVVASVLEKATPSKILINESTYEDRKKEKEDSGKNNVISGNYLYETDRFYKFHLNENVFSDNVKSSSPSLVSSTTDAIDDENECFAGYKDLLGGEVASTIRSAKGTVRGVKNRVRAGIATFLQIQQTTTKSYREKDAGKVVVYSTTMGIVRNTFHACLKVKQILRTHMVKFEERDVFMSSEYQAEIRDRMQSEQILIPQVFVDGQHIGDGETIDRLNESGELRRILKPYKSADACSTCQVCGGYGLLPCPVCNGSKKSVHRNHFTTEFVALKCMNCDEVGLVRCYNC